MTSSIRAFRAMFSISPPLKSKRAASDAASPSSSWGSLSFPYLRFCADGRLPEAHLEQEPPFEGLVQVVGQVGGGHKDAVELFHFFQDDVLYRIFGLRHAAAVGVFAFGEHGVGLVEQQYGFHLAFSQRRLYWVNTSLMSFSLSPNQQVLVAEMSTCTMSRPVARAICITLSVLPVPGAP